MTGLGARLRLSLMHIVGRDLSLPERDGCRSLRSALASIWRIGSRRHDGTLFVIDCYCGVELNAVEMEAASAAVSRERSQ